MQDSCFTKLAENMTNQANVCDTLQFNRRRETHDWEMRQHNNTDCAVYYMVGQRAESIKSILGIKFCHL